MVATQPQSIVVIGRRWFRKGPGNTYHSAEIIVDGKCVNKIPFAYGYGDQYLYNAFDWLAANGYITRESNAEAPFRWAERNNVTLTYSVTDVARKRDL
jgi:hypothetical protein